MVEAPLLCGADLGALRLGGPRLLCTSVRPCPQHDAQPTQADVLDWVMKRWPGHTSPVWRAMKFGEEAGEVLGAVVKESVGQKTKDDIRTEAAQAQICLMALAESVGFDLQEAVRDEWRDCATRVWGTTKVWGVLVWPERPERRADEYVDRDTAERMIHDTYGPNVALAWRHDTAVKSDDALWHDPWCEGTHGDEGARCAAYLLGPIHRIPVGEIRDVGRDVGAEQ